MFQDRNRDIIEKIIEKLQALEGEICSGVDVQINGESIVEDGVANIPVATSNALGLIIVGTGLNMGSNNKLSVYYAGDSGVKAGANAAQALTPARQHLSSFYGLAKAAGDTTQSESENAVGTYTDSAIDKILLMLGVSSLIAPHETETATNAYSIGEYFMFGGKLCKATDAIAIDDTIAIGTNCATTTIMAEIALLASAIAGGGT